MPEKTSTVAAPVRRIKRSKKVKPPAAGEQNPKPPGDAAMPDLNTSKVQLYELFLNSKISRGDLDREVDRLYSQKPGAAGARVSRPATARQPEAARIVTRYMWWSAGGGLIPIPIADFAAVSATQLLMLKELCNLYETPFGEQWGRNVISALVGSIAPSALKAIPGIGRLAGIVTGPAVNAAATYAVGKVFVQHFEAGGTLLTFDPAKMKGYFADYYEAGPRKAPAN